MYGLIFGVGIGAGIGILFGNLPMGAGIGAAIGLVLGGGLSAAKRKKPEAEKRSDQEIRGHYT